MKKGLLLASTVAFAFLLTTTQQSRADGSQSGSNGGYVWGLYWLGSGSAAITFPNGGGNYKITWTSPVSDVSGGKGWRPGQIRAVNYNCGQLTTYNSFGVYGWTENPTIEYYINDISKGGGTRIGTVSSDGATYNVVVQERVNAPSPFGTQTFWQYIDNRQSNNSLGANHTITMANHINYWKAHGGHGWGTTLYDTFLNFEAFSGPGTCNATVW